MVKLLWHTLWLATASAGFLRKFNGANGSLAFTKNVPGLALDVAVQRTKTSDRYIAFALP